MGISRLGVRSAVLIGVGVAAVTAALSGCGGGGGSPSSTSAAAGSAARVRTDLGTATLTPEAANAVTAKAGGDDATTIAATASDGTVWTLVVPAHALPTATAVTVTPSSASGSKTLSPKAGVEFAPDGLEFTSPATLTVAGAGAADFVYLGQQDGSQLAPAPAVAGGTGFEVWHFSSGVSSDTPPVSDIPRDPDAAAAELRADLDTMLQDAKDDDVTPSLPQGAQPSCQSTAAPFATVSQAVKAIVGDGETAYSDAEAEIMAYAKHIDPDRLSSMQGVADQIGEAWAKADAARAERVIKQYDDQADHAPQQLMLLREVVGYLPADSDSKVTAAMQAWSDNVAFALVERVQDDHDYEVVPLVIQLAQPTSGDATGGVKDSVSQALEKAMRFKESVEMNMQAPLGRYDATLAGQAQAPAGVATTVMNGTANGKYLSGEYAGGKGVIVPGQTWSTKLTINLHPCDHTAEVQADAYGTPEKVTAAGITVGSPFSGLDKSVKDALLYMNHGPFFLADLTNKQAQTVTKKSETAGGATLRFTLTLTHDPEPWTAPPPEPIP